MADQFEEIMSEAFGNGARRGAPGSERAHEFIGSLREAINMASEEVERKVNKGKMIVNLVATGVLVAAALMYKRSQRLDDIDKVRNLAYAAGLIGGIATAINATSEDIIRGIQIR